MPIYRALRLCQVDSILREEGDEFCYDGAPNGNLELVLGQGTADVPDPAPAAGPEAQRAWQPKARRA